MDWLQGGINVIWESFTLYRVRKVASAKAVCVLLWFLFAKPSTHWSPLAYSVFSRSVFTEPDRSTYIGTECDKLKGVYTDTVTCYSGGERHYASWQRDQSRLRELAKSTAHVLTRSSPTLCRGFAALVRDLRPAPSPCSVLAIIGSTTLVKTERRKSWHRKRYRNYTQVECLGFL